MCVYLMGYAFLPKNKPNSHYCALFHTHFNTRIGTHKYNPSTAQKQIPTTADLVSFGGDTYERVL